jgi:predicted Zn-dependent peptidase
MVNIRKTKLGNGITVITERIDGVRSFSLGFWVVVGSRNEKTEEKGISHFIEHTLFKGTKNRKALEIAKALESKGADLDAFTSKEVTCYYSRGLETQLKLASDVISDLITNPLFPEEELKKEIGVVTEEIKDHRDSPEQRIFDFIFEKVFTNHPLSNAILGKKEDVEKLTRKKVISYFKKWYRPERIVISSSGHIKHNELLSCLSQNFEQKGGRKSSFFTPVANNYQPSSFKFKKNGLFQAHLALATQTFKYNDPRKYSLLVLNTILGEGMSSILFQKIREEMGLVYQIVSFVEFFSDAGVFGIYLACAPDKIEIAREEVFGELENLREKGLSKDDIEEAKVRLKARLVLALESTSNRMMRLGKSEIYRREIISIDEIVSLINRVKITEVNDLVRELLMTDRFTSIYVGDFK